VMAIDRDARLDDLVGFEAGAACCPPPPADARRWVR
jgi:hypothetical protein